MFAVGAAPRHAGMTMKRVADAMAWVRRLAGQTRAALRDPASLGRRALNAGAWRLGGNTTSQILRLASNLVMTRLLAPEDFGLMAMALTVQTGLMMMTDIGLNTSVVRSDHGDDPRFLRTVWTIRITRHAMIAAVMMAFAGGLAVLAGAVDFGDTVYADPDLPPVLAALCVTLIINGANSVNLALGERHMRMARNIQVQLAGQIIGIVAMIAIAQFEPSVWALVWGGMIGAVGMCALSHSVVPGVRMAPLLDRAYADEIWSFGKWLMGASVFGFFGQYGDRLILGALLPPGEFGVYAIARLWLDAGGGTITKVAKPLGTAALSEVRRDRPKALFGIFRRIRLLQNAACIGMFLVFALIGAPMIRTLYPEEYHAVGVIIVALSPLMLFRMWGPFNQFLISTGDSRNIAMVTLRRAVALYVTLPIAFLLGGLPWALFAIATNGAWGVPQQIRLTARILPIRIAVEYARLAAAIALSAAVAAYAAGGAWGRP